MAKFSFNNKVVAITGAGSGIGRELAIKSASLGSHLALSDINEESLLQTKSLISSNVTVKTYVVDVSSKTSVFKYADDVIKDFGQIDYLFNNAGTSVIASFEHLSIEELEKVININLMGVIYGCKAFLPYMLTQDDGCIVNISSVFGLIAMPCSSAYNITKFGVRALTETLWQELSYENKEVRAVLVHPGGIDTNIKGTPLGKINGEIEKNWVPKIEGEMVTSAADCANEIINKVMRGDKRILVGKGAKEIFRLSRLFPNSYGSFIRKKFKL
jgi:short-subunit dehydrogenase